MGMKWGSNGNREAEKSGHVERHSKEAGYNQWGQSENGPLRGTERWRVTHEVKDRGETQVLTGNPRLKLGSLGSGTQVRDETHRVTGWELGTLGDQRAESGCTQGSHKSQWRT